MPKIEMSQVQSHAMSGMILWTEHVATRLRERGLKRADVIECIENGEIIEQYPDDTPFPSCLILGNCESGESLHIVVGLNNGILCCMITAYRPNLDKWESDFKTRREGR